MLRFSLVSRARTLAFVAVGSLLVTNCGGKGAWFGSRDSADTVVSPRPTPPTWSGNRVQLLLADAAVSCSYVDGSSVAFSPYAWSDSYLAEVGTLMDQARCAGVDTGLSRTQYWVKHRVDKSCTDQSPQPGQTAGGYPYIDPTPIANLNWAGDAVDGAERIAPFNLCIAQKLREIAPGAAGGEAFLLSSSDQIELVEVTRERAQIAMVQYALLGLAFAPHVSSSGTTATAQRLSPSFLRDWAQQHDVTAMGRDFATAIQMHVTLTQEVAQLMTRMGSAHAARGGGETGADDLWDAGGWYERALAALYGGDPLAQAADGTSPWQNALGRTVPGEPTPASSLYAPGARIIDVPGDLDWPTRYEMPYVDVDGGDPRVDTLRRLVKRFDVADVKVDVIPHIVHVCVPMPKRPCPPPPPPSCGGVVNRPATSDHLYRAVEAGLRTADCTQTNATGGCDKVAPSDVPDPASNYQSFTLYQRYGVTPDHADTLAAILDETTMNVCPYASGVPANPWTPTAVLPAPAMNLSGDRTATTIGDDGPWYHIGKDTKLLQRTLNEIEPLFSRNARLVVPTVMDDSLPIIDQGLLPATLPADGKRLLGGVGALVLTRSLIQAAWDVGSSDQTTISYLRLRPQMVGAIDAAVGEGGFSIVAAAQPTTVGSYSFATQPSNGGAYGWELRLDTSTADAWWNPSNPATYTIYAVANNPAAVSFALSPTNHDVFFDVTTLTGNPTATLVDVKTATDLPHSPSRWRFSISLPTNARWTFIGVRHDAGGDSYRLLSADVQLARYNEPVGAFGQALQPLDRPGDGQYHAFDGALNAAGGRALARDAINPTLPAFDGFGLPLRYVPPTDPTIINANAGETAVQAYLRRAHTIADKTKQDVDNAIGAMLTVAMDDQTRASNAQRAQALISQDVITMCGTKNANCDVSTVGLVLDFTQSWIQSGANGTQRPTPTCPPSSDLQGADQAKAKLDCVTFGMLKSLNTTVTLPNAVYQYASVATQPAFGNYAGGTLQSILIEQWADLRAVYNLAPELIAASDAAKARIDAAQSAFDAANAKAQDNCSAEAFGLAFLACNSVSAGFPSGASGTFNPGPLIEQKQKCDDLSKDVDPAKFQAISAMMEAFSTMAGQASKLTDATRALQDASARGFMAMQQTATAIAREQLEKQIADQSASLKTSFGLYRRYTGDVVAHAKAEVESARQLAVIARRALEARYLVDLSTSADTPPGVPAPPYTWADGIYGLELDIPAAVGLPAGGNAPGNIYSSTLIDYVNYLDAFASGYGILHPSAATGQPDSQLIELGPPLSASAVQPVADSYAWEFHCVDGDRWVSLPAGATLAGACGPNTAAPVRARIAFTLDPWARVNEDINHQPMLYRYNARWAKLAVNLEGSGIRDCSSTPTPECVGNTVVPFNLKHYGPAWASDFYEQWRSLGVPVGVIESGQALANELTLQIFDWNRAPNNAYVNSVARTEYADAPFGGTYWLELNPTEDPTIRLDLVSAVQILVSENYWTRQQ